MALKVGPEGRPWIAKHSGPEGRQLPQLLHERNAMSNVLMYTAADILSNESPEGSSPLIFLAICAIALTHRVLVRVFTAALRQNNIMMFHYVIFAKCHTRLHYTLALVKYSLPFMVAMPLESSTWIVRIWRCMLRQTVIWVSIWIPVGPPASLHKEDITCRKKLSSFEMTP